MTKKWSQRLTRIRNYYLSLNVEYTFNRANDMQDDLGFALKIMVTNLSNSNDFVYLFHLILVIIFLSVCFYSVISQLYLFTQIVLIFRLSLTNMYLKPIKTVSKKIFIKCTYLYGLSE